MPGLKISEQDYLQVMFAQVISDHMGTVNPEQHMELAEKLTRSLKEYAQKTANKQG